MSDKIFKDKLGGYSADFQPGDWDAMEAMLDKEPKRRAIAWWWWSAGAVVLAFMAGAGSTLLFMNGKATGLANELYSKQEIEHMAKVEPVHFSPVAELPEAAPEASFTPASNSSQHYSNTESKSVDQALSNANSGAEKLLNASNELGKGIEETTLTSNSAESTAIEPVSTQVSENESQNSTSTNVRKGYKELPMEKWTLEETLLAMEEAKKSALMANRDEGAETATEEASNETAVSSKESETTNLLVEEEGSAAPMVTEEEETVESSEDETELPLPAIGPGLWGFLEAGAGMLYTEPNISGTNLSGKYGLRFGIGYGRFALSSGLIYNAFNYGLDTVICGSGYPYQCPAALEAKVKAIEIPIALRVDMVKTERFRLWVEGGVGMNVKFTENFIYAFDQYINQPTTNVPPQPPNTSFVTGDLNDFQGVPIAAETRFLDSPTSLFATGSAKQVYWTGSIGLGATYYPLKQMGINMSVRYHHSTRKLGDQPKHLQQVGAWMGINYLFGR